LAGIGNVVRDENGEMFFETDPIAYIIDTTSGMRVREFTVAATPIISVAWHPIHPILLIGGEDGVLVYDIESGVRITGHIQTFDNESVDYDATGSYFTNSGGPIVNAQTGEIVGYFRFSSSPILIVRWSPDNSKIAMASMNGNIRIEEPIQIPKPVVVVFPRRRDGRDGQGRSGWTSSGQWCG
jgi:WD40 repeat protein